MPEIVLLFVGLVIVLSLAIILLTARGSLSCFMRLAEPWREHLSAEHRARLLLREMLAPAEYQQLIRFGYLEVPSPKIEHRTYRIPGAGGLVKVFDRGSAVMELCLQPAEPLPDGDVIVLHKLMITANEDEYLAKANRFAPGIISMRYQHF
jgi:hypothetical protein